VTGLGNRRYAEQELERRLGEMKRTGEPLVVLFMDIDRFKQVNDTHGHDVGDVVLRMVAETLVHELRSYDFAGRWGGEEFVVVLPNSSGDEGGQIGERLRAAIEKSSRKISEAALTVTVSVGAYTCDAEDTPESAVGKADKLMYESKRKGGNCVTTG
jgi:diguanylate cyclase (GGDEF)-like protein